MEPLLQASCDTDRVSQSLAQNLILELVQASAHSHIDPSTAAATVVDDDDDDDDGHGDNEDAVDEDGNNNSSREDIEDEPSHPNGSASTILCPHSECKPDAVG